MDETELPESFNNISTSTFIASLQTSPFTRSIHILQEATTDMISSCIYLYFFSQPFFLLLGDFIAILSAPNLSIRLCACYHIVPQSYKHLYYYFGRHTLLNVQSWKNFVHMDVFVPWFQSHLQSFKKTKRNKKKETDKIINKKSRCEPFFSFLCSVFYFGLFGGGFLAVARTGEGFFWYGITTDWGTLQYRHWQIEGHCNNKSNKHKSLISLGMWGVFDLLWLPHLIFLFYCKPFLNQLVLHRIFLCSAIQALFSLQSSSKADAALK